MKQISQVNLWTIVIYEYHSRAVAEQEVLHTVLYDSPGDGIGRLRYRSSVLIHDLGLRARKPLNPEAACAQVQLIPLQIQVHAEGQTRLAKDVHVDVDMWMVGREFNLEMREGSADALEEPQYRVPINLRAHVRLTPGISCGAVGEDWRRLHDPRRRHTIRRPRQLHAVVVRLPGCSVSA